MNRFFCTVCNKIKRVQHYPANVVNREALTPALRKGQCRRHSVQTRTHSHNHVLASKGGR